MVPYLRHRSPKSAHLAQAAVLAAVGLVLIVALGVREVRLAGTSADLDSAQRDLSALVFGSHMSRSELRTTELNPFLPQVPRVGDRARLQAVLPAGSVFDVVVKGGFTAPRRDNLRGEPIRTHMAYAFEMAYRREIESNDGQRIVERRTFGSVRMAKILAATDNMHLDLGPPEQLPFEDVPFPGPDEAITVGPLASVARAMLGEGQSDVIQAGTSVAFLETDPLCGKSVRLTYLDGVGIESVEAPGRQLNGFQLVMLFRQNLLPAGLRRLAAVDEPVYTKVNADRLIAMTDPTKPPDGETSVLLESINDAAGRLPECRVLHTSSESDYHNRRASPADDELQAALPIGMLQYDSGGTYIRQATITWPFFQLEIFSDRLLYENEFRDIPENQSFTVQYYCRRTGDGSD